MVRNLHGPFGVVEIIAIFLTQLFCFFGRVDSQLSGTPGNPAGDIAHIGIFADLFHQDVGDPFENIFGRLCAFFVFDVLFRGDV